MSTSDTKAPLDISYDADAQRLVIRTPGGLVVHVNDPARNAKPATDAPDLVISPDGDSLRLNAAQSLSVNSMGTLNLSGQDGVTITSGGDVKVVADTDLTLAAAQTATIAATDIKADATASFTGKSGTESTLTSDGDTIVHGTMIYIN